MAAGRHIHPDQLAMFLPAGRLANPARFYPADLDPESRDPDTATREEYKELREWKVHEGSTGAAHDTTRRPGENSPTGRSELTMRESMEKHGFDWTKPVTVSPRGLHSVDRPAIEAGHHRVYVAASIDPKMEVPLKWYDWIMGGGSYGPG